MPIVAKLAVYSLETLFSVGMLGSAVVVFLTSIEDAEVFFTRQHPAAGEPEEIVDQQQHELS